jgi:epoxyqueuosine reductase
MTRSVTLQIKDEAARLGFVACGITTAEANPETQQRFERRLDQGFLDGLPWMNRARAERATTPIRLLQNAKSIVTLAAAYEHRRRDGKLDGELRGRVAGYAWGRDYHRILETRLKSLCRSIEQIVPGAACRMLVDYGPLAERAYAERSGLGWFGKNTNLLLPGVGSWVVLSEVVTTARLDPDMPLRKACGSCRRCVEACPTGALVDGYVLDNQRCISYQTIENRGPIPTELRPLIGDWLFGCDICQDVCPVGRGALPPALEGLSAGELDRQAPALIPLLSLTDAEFSQRFAGRAVLRAKRDGLVRNACVVLGNLGDKRAIPALVSALQDPSALVRGHAAWALGRLDSAAARNALQTRLACEGDDWVRGELEAALATVTKLQ